MAKFTVQRWRSTLCQLVGQRLFRLRAYHAETQREKMSTAVEPPKHVPLSSHQARKARAGNPVVPFSF